MKREEGHAFILVLATLAIGALLIVPFLNHASIGRTAANISKEWMIEQYAVDAAAEHAIWQLKSNVDGLIESLTLENTSVSYSITVNSEEVFITVSIPQPPEPEPTPETQPGQHLHVGKSTNKHWIQSSSPNTLTYTIALTNYGTSAMHIGEIGDIIPRPFQYVSGSSSGITTDDPTITWRNNQHVLTWSFKGADRPKLEAGETKTQTFQASVLRASGIYYDEAWAVDDPPSVGKVSTGPTAPVAAGVYEIKVQTQRANIHATVAISSTGEVTILSWQIE